jgi:hypothetical protein
MAWTVAAAAGDEAEDALAGRGSQHLPKRTSVSTPLT